MKKSVANRLVKLYNELSNFEGTYNQDSCQCCALGNGIKAGIINGFRHPSEDFENAERWIWGSYEELQLNSTVNSYLFGLKQQVGYQADAMGWPSACETAEDFIERLEVVFDFCEYDLKDDV